MSKVYALLVYVYASHKERNSSLTHQSNVKQTRHSNTKSQSTIYISKADHRKVFAIKCQTYTTNTGKTEIKMIQRRVSQNIPWITKFETLTPIKSNLFILDVTKSHQRNFKNLRETQLSNEKTMVFKTKVEGRPDGSAG